VIKDTDDDILMLNRLATKMKSLRFRKRRIESKIKVTAHNFNATAKAAIEAAGGEAVIM
jgi:large subunit ribosomal protein L15